MVAKQMAKALGKSNTKAKEEDKLRKYLMLMVEVAVKDAKSTSPKQTAVSAAVKSKASEKPAPQGLLCSILKSSRNLGRK